MRKKVLIIISVTLLIYLPSCNQHMISDRNTPFDETIVKVTGRIVHMRLEGGFFGIVSDDDKTYLPIDLPKEFQQDGLKIQFEGRLRPDISGIHMWGTYIELISIDEMQ